MSEWKLYQDQKPIADTPLDLMLKCGSTLIDCYIHMNGFKWTLGNCESVIIPNKVVSLWRYQVTPSSEVKS